LVTLKFPGEGKIMRRNLLIAALVLMAIWATGCIIIDAATLESRQPATIRFEECVIHQSLLPNAPALEPGNPGPAAVTAQ
jgi:hypothetical protein